MSILSTRTLRLAALVSLSALGCAPPSASAGRGHASQQPVDLIVIAEIERQPTRFNTAYDIVHALRPTMLTSRGATGGPRSRLPVWESNAGIKVYLDGLRYGGVESLASIPASTVREIRWLSAMDATTRFGTGNAAGAIVVTSVTGRR